MEKIMCLKPNMFCDEHTNRCQTRQRIENDLLTNFQQEGPKFRNEEHITLTGGGGTDAQRRHATGRYGRQLKSFCSRSPLVCVQRVPTKR